MPEGFEKAGIFYIAVLTGQSEKSEKKLDINF